DKMENRVYSGPTGSSSDGETQRRKRIERMHRGHFEGNAAPISLPFEKAVHKTALGRYFGRSLLPPMFQERGKQHRLQFDFQIIGKLFETCKLQVRKWRNKIEIPRCRRLSHLTPPVVR